MANRRPQLEAIVGIIPRTPSGKKLPSASFDPSVVTKLTRLQDDETLNEGVVLRGVVRSLVSQVGSVAVFGRLEDMVAPKDKVDMQATREVDWGVLVRGVLLGDEMDRALTMAKGRGINNPDRALVCELLEPATESDTLVSTGRAEVYIPQI